MYHPKGSHPRAERVTQLRFFEIYAVLERAQSDGRLLYGWACLEGTGKVLFNHGSEEEIEHARIVFALSEA